MKIKSNLISKKIEYTNSKISIVPQKIQECNVSSNRFIEENVKEASTIKNIESINLEQLSDTITLIPRDEGIYNHEYRLKSNFGGNQGALMEDVDIFISDRQVKEIIRKYYSDFTSEDLELLFYRMNTIGCGYVAGINTILQEYSYRSNEDFQARFGFPPGGLFPGEYNYEYLFLDFFLYYAKYERGFDSIEEVYGNAEDELKFNNGEIQDRALTESFESKGMGGTYLPDVARVLQKYLKEKGIEIEIENPKNIPLQPGTELWKKIKVEIEKKGFKVKEDQILYAQATDAEIIQNILDSHKQIIISADNFDLYYPNDRNLNGKLDDIRATDVGAHAMSLVGISSDGKYIVSSWGKEYLINPEEIRNIEIYEYKSFSPLPMEGYKT